ncbi:MAG: hypothetical protein KC657_24860 [Myxococcales bacterium]|nr:hypothetical protein [Myxococcales bacterium]
MSVELRLDSGERADLETLEGDAVTVRSPVPAPPGARVSTVVVETGAALRVKSHGSKRDGELFVVRGRLIDATRELRAWLAAQLSA